MTCSNSCIRIFPDFLGDAQNFLFTAGISAMIELHYWTTPNGHKITMFLEETGLEYKIVPVHIGKGEQFKPDFLAVSPNNRIPAILDRKPKDGGAPIPVFESRAILFYLAEKTRKFLPTHMRHRSGANQRLVWPNGRFGPKARPTCQLSHISDQTT